MKVCYYLLFINDGTLLLRESQTFTEEEYNNSLVPLRCRFTTTARTKVISRRRNHRPGNVWNK